MKQSTLSDLVKTLFPNGVVLGAIHAVEVKAYMEITLLALSIVYTAIRLGLLWSRKNRDEAVQDDLDEVDPPGYD